MSVSRKNNPDFRQGLDSLGRNTWLRNHKGGDEPGAKPGSAQSLLVDENENIDIASSAGFLPRPPVNY
jgi:hypothetical protein